MSTDKETAWIAERAKCDMGVLVHDFYTLVHQNVQTMNALNQQQRGAEFHFTPQQQSAFTITQHLPKGQTRTCWVAAYSETRQCIEVTLDDPDRKYYIQTRWDAEKSKCRLVVTLGTGEAVEFPHKHLWKAVQHILEPFFFPS